MALSPIVAELLSCSSAAGAKVTCKFGLFRCTRARWAVVLALIIKLVHRCVHIHEADLLVRVHFIAKDLVVADDIHSVVRDVARRPTTQIIVCPNVVVLVVPISALDKNSFAVHCEIRRVSDLLPVNVAGVHRDVVFGAALVIATVLVRVASMRQVRWGKSPERGAFLCST